jgi:hypothetical protein
VPRVPGLKAHAGAAFCRDRAGSQLGHGKDIESAKSSPWVVELVQRPLHPKPQQTCKLALGCKDLAQVLALTIHTVMWSSCGVIPQRCPAISRKQLLLFLSHCAASL